jgi:hypothetical protein
MTTPIGGSNNINLASMWIPIMPETSHMVSAMEDLGKKSRVAFGSGFNSGAEEFGTSFANKAMASFGKQFQQANFGYGIGSLVEKMSAQVDAGLASKLKTQIPKSLEAATKATDEYRAAVQRMSPIMQREAELTERLSALKTKHNSVSAEAHRLQAQANQAWNSGNVSLAEQQRLQTLATEATSRSTAVLRQKNKVEEQLSTRQIVNKPKPASIFHGWWFGVEGSVGAALLV